MNLTGYIHIKDNQAFVNGEPLFERKFNHSFLEELYEFLKIDYPKFLKMDNQSKLGFLAAELLMRECKLNKKFRGEEIALVLSNKSASEDTDINYFNSIRDKEDYFPSPGLFVYTLANIVSGELAIRHKLKGENTFFISEAFNGELICFQINSLFKYTKTSACIGGWVDYSATSYEAFLFAVNNSESEMLNGKVLNQLYNK